MPPTRFTPIPLAEACLFLEPGPVVLLSTSHNGRPNVMAMSGHTVVSSDPPRVGCLVSHRGHSHLNLRKTKECVIAIPDFRLRQKVVNCGSVSGRDVDKFEAIGLTPLAAANVNAPLIAECHANLECRVIDTKLVAKYDFFILEILAAWLSQSKRKLRTLHHAGADLFIVAGKPTAP